MEQLQQIDKADIERIMERLSMSSLTQGFMFSFCRIVQVIYCFWPLILTMCRVKLKNMKKNGFLF